MPSNECTICSTTIRTMAFKGTGVCGELCRKEARRRSDEQGVEATPDAPAGDPSGDN